MQPILEIEEPSGTGASTGGFLKLLRFARPHARLLIGAALLMFVSTGLNLSLPLMVKTGLDRVLTLKSLAGLDLMAARFAGMIALLAIASMGQYAFVACAGNRVLVDIRAGLFSHLQRMPVAFFDRARSGDLASLLSNDVAMLRSALTDDLVHFLGDVVTLVGGISLAVVIDWRLTVVTLVLLGLVFGSYAVLGAPLRRLTNAGLDALADVLGATSESLAGNRIVKAFAREKHKDDEVAGLLKTHYQIEMKTSMLESALSATAGTGFVLVLAGVAWYGGRAVIAGTISAGALAGFVMTVMIITGPMSGIAGLYAHLQRTSGAADRVFEILGQPQEARDPPETLAFPDGPCSVRFENIRFGYVPEIPVLRDFDLELPAGKVTALVGPSGCGKSTATSLLYRFYEPQCGEIRIDGVSIRDIGRAELRNGIGIVPQEPVLFNATIFENIRFGRLEASREEIEDAARAANADEFILTLPDGYETILGERGANLSGGQRQRIAIARAILKNPRILILDEATSALDTRSEALVIDALDRLMRNRTTLVIAHRLNTIQSADQIAVVDEGKIVEVGSHRTLIRSDGAYSRLQAGLAGQSRS